LKAGLALDLAFARILLVGLQSSHRAGSDSCLLLAIPEMALVIAASRAALWAE
jgi:hypothetical protein